MILAMISGAVLEVAMIQLMPNDERVPHVSSSSSSAVMVLASSSDTSEQGARGSFGHKNTTTIGSSKTKEGATSFSGTLDRSQRTPLSGTSSHVVQIRPTAGEVEVFDEDDLDVFNFGDIDLGEINQRGRKSDEPGSPPRRNLRIGSLVGWTPTGSARGVTRGKSDHQSHGTISLDDFDFSMPLPRTTADTPSSARITQQLPRDDFSADFSWEFDDFPEHVVVQDEARSAPSSTQQAWERDEAFQSQQQFKNVAGPATKWGLSFASVAVWLVSVIVSWLCAAQYSATACKLGIQVWPLFLLFVCDGCFVASALALILMKLQDKSDV